MKVFFRIAIDPTRVEAEEFVRQFMGTPTVRELHRMVEGRVYVAICTRLSGGEDLEVTERRLRNLSGVVDVEVLPIEQSWTW